MIVESRALKAKEPLPNKLSNTAQWRSATVRYAVAISLMGFVYILASLNPAETGAIPLSISHYFVIFWLTGGSLTLGCWLMLQGKSKESESRTINIEHLL
jgi:hypothetical protein